MFVRVEKKRSKELYQFWLRGGKCTAAVVERVQVYSRHHDSLGKEVGTRGNPFVTVE